jgi:hypothetical protein
MVVDEKLETADYAEVALEYLSQRFKNREGWFAPSANQHLSGGYCP